MSRMLLGLVALLACSVSAFGQAASGEINGSVVDSSGAVVSGAPVTVTNPATGFTRTLQTNHDGLYSIPALPPGLYSLKVEMRGFQAQVRNDVELQVGQIAKLDFTLQIGKCQ